MLQHKKKLIEEIEKLKIQEKDKLPLKIQSFSGQLLPEILKQENMTSPVALVSLQNAVENDNFDVVTTWIIFVVSNQQGKLTSNDAALLLAAQIAEKLDDLNIGRIDQEPTQASIKNLFNGDYSKMKVSVYAVEFQCVYENFIVKEFDDKELKQINIDSKTKQNQTILETEIKS